MSTSKQMQAKRNSMKKEERRPQFEIFVGEPGCGKTTAMRKWMSLNKRNLVFPANRMEWRKSYSDCKKLIQEVVEVPSPDTLDPKKKVWMFEHPEMEKFIGNRSVNLDKIASVRHYPTLFRSVCLDHNLYQNGGLFIDDFRNYILSNGQLDGVAGQYFRSRRHNAVDIFMACHKMQDVSADLLGFGARFWLFKQSTMPSKAALDKLSPEKRKELLLIIKVVNAHRSPYMCMPFKTKEH